MIINTEFDIGEQVIMHRDASYVAIVQRIIIASPRIGACVATYEVAYFDAGGTFKEHSLYEWQLTRRVDHA